jgi:CHAT domain-containing protein
LLAVARERTVPPDELREEESLARRVARLQGEVEALAPGADDGTAGAYERAHQELLDAEAALSAHRHRLSRRYPIVQGEQYSLERIQATLSERTAIVGWLDVNPHEVLPMSWGYVLRNRGPVRWAPVETGDGDGPTGRAAHLREALHFAAAWPYRLGRGEKIAPAAEAVWRERLASLEPYLEGVEELVVIPSAPLFGVPLGALKDSDGLWIEDRFAISYAPSATIHAWLAARPQGRTPAGARALALGDPPFAPDHLRSSAVGPQSGGVPFDVILRSALAGDKKAIARLPRLPRTRHEVQAVVSYVPQSSLLLGPDASEQELVELVDRGALREYSHLHFATHALVDRRFPERSALVLSQIDLPDPLEAALSGRRIYDGLVTAKEIAAEWELNAELVTLSSCQSALGRERRGEGYLGLAQAFLHSGARTLLVSLWPVDDAATALLMARFYENLFAETKPRSKARVLQDAKRWLREYTDEEGRRPFQHPAYWSAFILIGDPRA